MVQLMEPKIRAEVDEILNDVISKGTGSCDFVREIAAELPLRVIAELLGVPRGDRDKIFDWSNRLIGFDDPEFQTSIEDARQAAMEIWMYANSLAEERIDRDGTDLISVLINSEIDGERLSEMEFDAFFLLLSVAGNETTRNALSGGMLALLQNPEQLALMRSNPELIPQAVEETLRWVTPVNHFRRTATRDLEVRGVPIKENDKLVLFYCSANRDEEVFADPFKFDITRNPNPHLAFGVGEHFCMGASLARLEMRILFEQLIARMDDIALAGEVRKLRSNFINGIKTMPITFRGV
jgi:cholest-4-en-3-one 26-monooxygenase